MPENFSRGWLENHRLYNTAVTLKVAKQIGYFDNVEFLRYIPNYSQAGAKDYLYLIDDKWQVTVSSKCYGYSEYFDNCIIEELVDVEAIKNADVMATAELSMSESESLPGTIGRRNTLINGGVYAFLNTASNKLSNVRVRQAIQRGIDMSKVREGIDETQVLDYPFLPRQEEVELPKLAEYNADEAKKLITDAGLKFDDEGKIIDKAGEKVVLDIAVQKREELSRVAERFGKGLEELGFGVSMDQ